MLLRCLCVLSGGYALGLCPALPADDLILSVALLTASVFYRKRWRPAAWFLAGFMTLWIAAWSVLDDRLDPVLEGQTIDLDARIAGFPDQRDDSLRFVVTPLERPDLPARIRLNWSRPGVMPLPGESWQLRVRLRRPHGYANPDGFDYEGFLFREKIGATGYVVAHRNNQKLAAVPVGRIAELRQAFVVRVTRLLPDDDAAAVMLAVGVGARHKITRAQWDRYAMTGTSHLMAISGLHVGLAAGGVLALAWVLLALCFPRANARDGALIAAVLAAGVYVTVSGFGVPARRAFLMALLGAAALLRRRRIDAASILALSCLTLFFSDPLAIHTPGFKLSFAAVAILLWTMQQHQALIPAHADSRAGSVAGSIRRLTWLQLALLMGLFPLTYLLFGRFAPIAPVVNLLVLPIFNFVAVPFCLIGMLLGGPLQAIGDPLLVAAHASIRLVLAIVSFAADLPGMHRDLHAVHGLAIALVCLPALHVILPAGWPGRKIAPIALVAVIAMRPPATPAACLDYHVLDVGQGLATVLRAGDYTLLFDTGPSFRGGSSTAELAIIPFLESRGIDRVDTLIVSHADQDHAGGVAAIVQQFAIGEALVGEFLPEVALRQSPCGSAPPWTVNGVQFRMLHPGADVTWEGNNASCVLEVVTGAHKLLLTGDIENPVEASLLASGVIHRVNAVVVPHHGSRTSSTLAFVSALRPDLAIVSAGYGNRWGFPKADVVERWERSGARLLDTASYGAISQRVCAATGVEALQLERRDARKFWHEFSGQGF